MAPTPSRPGFRFRSVSHARQETKAPAEKRLQIEGLRHGPDPARGASPPFALLRLDPEGGLQVLYGLQPHVPAELLRRSGGGVLASLDTRRLLGRGCRRERAVPTSPWAPVPT